MDGPLANCDNFVKLHVPNPNPELKTPLQSGLLDGSQWCPQYRGSTVYALSTDSPLNVTLDMRGVKITGRGNESSKPPGE